MLFGASYGTRTHTLLEEELLCVPNKLVPKAGVEPAKPRFLAVYLCQFGYSGILLRNHSRPTDLLLIHYWYLRLVSPTSKSTHSPKPCPFLVVCHKGFEPLLLWSVATRFIQLS